MDTFNSFNILYEDEFLIAISKPPGIMVHRTKITEDKIFVLQILRKQIKRRVYPIHRLDRGTSGVLVFAKTQEIAGNLNEQFRQQKISKKYHAIIRGFVEETGVVDYALSRERWLEKREAVTHYKRLSQSEVPFAIGPYAQSRYSLVEARPLTGRRHQIRRHFSHIRHPVIGDKKHGDIKHNKFFKNELGIDRMLLHASELQFKHPVSDQDLVITSPLDPSLQKAINILNLRL